MSHPYYHAKSSAKRFGGVPDDYLKLHQFPDQSKAHIADARHRMWLHNAAGCFLGEQAFGVTIKNSDNKDVPVRLVLETHILEDLSWIPSLSECFESMELRDWMGKKSKPLSKSKTLNDNP